MMVLLTMALPLSAQDTITTPKRYSLTEAVEYALQNNAGIRNSKLDMEIAGKRVWETTATGLPQVSATANYMNNLKLRTTLIPAEFFGGAPGTYQAVQFGTQHNADATISANQLLFNGPYIVGLQAAQTYRKLSEQNSVKTENDVKQTLKEAYFLVLLVDESLRTMEANLTNLRKTREETRAMLNAGFLDETDLDQLSVAVMSLENAITSMERQGALAMNLLKFQMGISFDAPVELSDSLQSIFTEMDLTEILLKDFTLEEHIDYKLLSTQEQLAYLDMKRTKYEYLPSLNMYYSLTESAQRREFNLFDPDENWYESSMLGFTLNVPIFSSGSRMARVSQKKLELEKVKNSKKQASEGLQLEYQQAKFDFSNALEKYELELKNVELARKIIERTTVKYTEGLAGSLDLTNANNQYLAAYSNLINSQIELMNAKLRLDKSLNNL
jgi:outer membrane protein TolC